MISVTILTKNSGSTLEETLASVRDFKEVLVVDTGSSDETFQIVKKFPNVVLHHAEFVGFGPTHNLASSLASQDWILSLDSDEVLSEELASEILQIRLDPRCVYSIPRHNYYNGRHIKWCAGWHPDRIVRLYHRKTTCFSDDAVHEKILLKDLLSISLRFPMRHTPYRNMGDFLAKMQTYTTLFAEQNRHQKRGSLLLALLHAWHAFFKSYFLKRGFLGGKEGFIISAYNSHTAFYKYLKLSE